MRKSWVNLLLLVYVGKPTMYRPKHVTWFPNYETASVIISEQSHDVWVVCVWGFFYSYLRRSSWRSCRVLLWTPGRPMSPAGPHRCSWPVCHPGTPQPTAGTHTPAHCSASSSHTASSPAPPHTHAKMDLKNYAASSASSEKSLKVWPCVCLEHLSHPVTSPLPSCPLSAIYANWNFSTKSSVSMSTVKIVHWSPTAHAHNDSRLADVVGG